MWRLSVFYWSLLTVLGLGAPTTEQQLACKGAGNLTEVLCSRSDTSMMCSLLGPPQTAAVAPPHWSLDARLTILAMPDSALHRAWRMRLIDASEDAWEALASGSRQVQRGGLRLLWVVDASVAPPHLPEEQELKAWHVDVYGDGHPPLEHVSFSHGPEGTLIAKHRWHTASVTDSVQVCGGSWILFVDGPLAPTELRLDAVPHSKLGWLATWSKSLAQYGLFLGIVVGALGVWILKPIVDEARLPKLSADGKNGLLNLDVQARSCSLRASTPSRDFPQQAKLSQERPSGRSPQERQPRADPWDRQDSPWAGLQAPSDVGLASQGKGPWKRTENGLPLGLSVSTSPSIPESPEDHVSIASSQQLSSLESLLLPLADEPELSLRTPLSTRPLRPSLTMSRSPQGSPVSNTTSAGGSARSAANTKSSQQLAWEVVDQRLKQWENQSWQLREEDLEICLRPDGSDWRLGTGSYGTVYRGLMHQSTPVAVKIIREQSQQEKLRFVQEISLLKNLRHTNIVQFTGALIDPDQIVLATEFMPRGDLWHALRGDTQRLFAWSRRGRQVALDIVRGLVYMHSKSVVHLDIKSCNVLLSRDGVAKVADVGLARLLTREGAQVSVQGTFEWAAPELLMGQACTDKADIYSLGVVLWEIITGEEARLRALRDISDHEAPANIARVVDACRESNPKDRPTAVEVFELFTSSDSDRPRPPSRSLGRAATQPVNGRAAAKLPPADRVKSLDPERAYSPKVSLADPVL
ncbi:hypothetical protein WJX74_003168 [Apatococcus lobatus]|uniref:Protein kinase domain-containing protein n=1 Tax=Apatococcus lobatus TaxID=904363 RepID=A0AAW1QCC7_9CHLO